MQDFEGKLREVLEKAAEDRSLVGLSVWDEDKDTFLVGYVGQLTDVGLTIRSVSTDGLPDGVWCGKLEQVTRFHYDSEYLRGVQVLCDGIQELLQDSRGVPEINPKAESIHLDFLKGAQKLSRMVEIVDDEENKISGFVREVGDDYVEIQNIESDSGLIDGFCIVRDEDIHHVECGSRDLLKLEYLNRKRYDLP